MRTVVRHNLYDESVRDMMATKKRGLLDELEIVGQVRIDIGVEILQC
jgi:hypothetical protein